MSAGHNAIELLRLRDELDALDELRPLGVLTALFGWLVVYERRARRARHHRGRH